MFSFEALYQEYEFSISILLTKNEIKTYHVYEYLFVRGREKLDFKTHKTDKKNAPSTGITKSNGAATATRREPRLIAGAEIPGKYRF